MKLLILWLLPFGLIGQTLTNITGEFVYPNASFLNGSVVVQLSRPTVVNNCVSKQVVSFKPVTALVVRGDISISLYPSYCLTISTPKMPLLLAGSGIGNSGSATFTGTTYGTISLLIGTVPGAQSVLAYFIPQIPGISLNNQCFLQPSNSNATNSGVAITYNSQRITLTSVAALTTGQTYTWNWICTIPYTANIYNQAKQLMYSARWIVPVSGSVTIWGTIAGNWSTNTETWDALDANDITTVDVTQLN